MVPEGWKIGKLRELSSKIGSGITPKGGRETYLDEGIPLIRSQNVGWGKLMLDDVAFIDERQHDSMSVSKVRHGDVLLNITGASIGRSAIYQGDDNAANVNQHVCIIRAKPTLSPEYLKAVLISDGGQKQIEQFQAGGNRQGLNFEQIGSFAILLPPLPEQQKIAEILGTWDKAIETTEALLANARAQKRALMQSLLTGTRRFPGFEDHPWREVRLQQIADIIVSNVDKKSEPDELPVRLCNYTDVYKNDTIRANMDFMEATATPAQIKKFGLKVGDVIITKDSEDPSDIAVPAYVAETADDLVCGYHLAIIRANHHADGRFLKYCFELPHTRYYFGARANGATRFGLNIDSIETAVFRVPSIAEQRIIADAIQLVEQEIGQTIGMLDHLRTEKKSLMQQLLTGKRRVIV